MNSHGRHNPPRKAASTHDAIALAWLLPALRQMCVVWQQGGTLPAEADTGSLQQAEGAASVASGAQIAQMPLELLQQAQQILQMQGLQPGARLLEAMGGAAALPHTQELLSEASQALEGYLHAALDEPEAAAGSLFPVYQKLSAVLGLKKTHPADLWSAGMPEQLKTLDFLEDLRPYAPQQTTASLEQAVLAMMKSPSAQSAGVLRDVCARHCMQAQPPAQAVWLVATAVWEAVAQGWLAPDLWVKRLASQLLMHHKQQPVSEAWPQPQVREMLFFCALAQNRAPADAQEVAAFWHAVSTQWQLQAVAPGSYARGLRHCDGAELVAVQAQVEAAAQAWSAWVGGDNPHPQQLQEALTQVATVLASHWPESERLQAALQQLADVAANAPGDAQVDVPVGVAVATVLLVMEAVLAQPDTALRRSALRANALAAVVEELMQGQAMPAWPEWASPLYRQWHEASSVVAVVQELQHLRWDVEQRIEQSVQAPDALGADWAQDIRAMLQPLVHTLWVLDLEEAAHALMQVQAQLDAVMHQTPLERTDTLLQMAQQLVAVSWQFECLLLLPMQPPQTLRSAVPVAVPEAPATQAQAETAQGGEETQGALSDHEIPALQPDVQPFLAHDLRGSLQAPSDWQLAEDAVQRMVQNRVEQEGGAGKDTESAPTLATTRVVAELRLPQPLLDVFQGEAEQGSAQLMQHLQAWALQGDKAQAQAAAHVAHSLVGCASAIGFEDVSALARAIEDALLHVHRRPPVLMEPVVMVLLAGGNEFRRLIQQFAQGVLPPPQPQILQALQDICHADAVVPGILQDETGTWEPQSADGKEEAIDWASPQEQVLEAQLPVMPVQESGALAPSFAAALEALDPPQVPEPAAAESPAQAAPAATELPEPELEGVDALDPDLFPIFEEEAAELLPAIGSALRAWAAAPAQASERQSALRALHTLKGSARLAGAMRLGEMAHRLESQIETLSPQCAQPEVEIEPLLLRVDALQHYFEQLRGAHKQSPDAYVLVHSQEKSEVVPMPASQSDAWALWTRSVRDGMGGQVLPEWNVAAGAQAASGLTARTATGPSVRVRAALLDRLINEAGEVLIARARLDARMGVLKNALHDLGGDLDRLRQQLRDLEVQSESQMQSRLTYSKDVGGEFDPLEFDRFTRVQELTRMMAESVNDVATLQRQLQREVVGAEDDLVAQGRQAKALQRDLLRTRMVELDSVSERLYAVVRSGAYEAGKQVRLEMTGGSIEMDRGVLERMLPAFEHLLRNCVVHGIEAPEVREASGKPAQGLIEVQVQQEGNDVAVVIRDDGAGLHVERIRAKALSLELVQPDEVVDEARAAQLIFMPGFSTATEVTGLSGRGIGMDVLRNEVHALGGRIETQSITGQGTAFRVVLPLTTAVTQVVMVRMGSFTAAVPANMVETVQRLDASALQAAYDARAVAHEGRQVPLYWGGAIWQQSAHSTELGRNHAAAAPADPDGMPTAWPVLILRSAAQRIAVHVDELLGQQEVVVKHLGPQMAQLPGLTGMSVLPSGAVALIYNPVALTAVYGAQIQALSQGQAGDAQWGGVALAPSVADAEAPLVMVVDDSITVRRVTQRLLQRAGYRVLLAADGVQALEKLAQHQPALVLTDIEMPQMDGLTLVRHLREDARWQALPVIVITSRTADKHRAVAQAMGVNHYLGKPYRDEELMGLVQHYAALQHPHKASDAPTPEAA